MALFQQFCYNQLINSNILGKLKYSIFIAISMMMISCKVYKQDIMFKEDEDLLSTQLTEAVYNTEMNYHIQKNDLLNLDVYTNKGERIIDPNFELRSGVNQNIQNQTKIYSYLVQQDGQIKLPIIGLIKLENLTINDAETVIQKAYDGYYKDSFVKLNFLNKRVIVLGGLGGQVIPLENENTSLIEVIAMAGGVQLGDKVKNIKVIRGDLNNPQIFAIDLTTIEGMKGSIVSIQPGDVIYVEPWRRAWVESLKDVAPILSLITSLLTLTLVVQRL